jgi:hypothetical protein
LEYERPNNAVLKFVDEDDKITVKEHLDQNDVDVLKGLNGQTVLINESGVYQLIFQSKMEKAKAFRKYVFEVVLPTIRKTGTFQLPRLEHNQFIMLTENDLHKRVVAFIRQYFDMAVINATLGELQTTDEKRIECKKLGYTAGASDLLIFNHNHQYNGFAIEFKNPNGKGVISEKQIINLSNMRRCTWKTIISDNYDELVMEIMKYFSTVRICCEHCNRKFKTKKSLGKHLKYIHRITKP